MSRGRLLLAALSLVACLFGQQHCVAQKGNSKGGIGNPNNTPMWNAGAITIPSGLGSAFAAGGQNNYFADGTNLIECIEGDGESSRPEAHVPFESLNLNLGTPINQTSASPFGNSLTGTIDPIGFSLFPSPFHMGYGWPAPGETLSSIEDGYGGLNLRFEVAGTSYYLAWEGLNGEVSASGYDDDNDGVRDRVVMTATSSAQVRLFRLDEIAGKGKKTSLQWVEVGYFTNVPYSITFHNLYYQRSAPTDTVLSKSWPWWR